MERRILVERRRVTDGCPDLRFVNRKKIPGLLSTQPGHSLSIHERLEPPLCDRSERHLHQTYAIRGYALDFASPDVFRVPVTSIAGS